MHSRPYTQMSQLCVAILHDKVMHDAKAPVPGALFLPGMSGPSLLNGRIPNTCVDEIHVGCKFAMHVGAASRGCVIGGCKMCTCWLGAEYRSQGRIQKNLMGGANFINTNGWLINFNNG